MHFTGFLRNGRVVCFWGLCAGKGGALPTGTGDGKGNEEDGKRKNDKRKRHEKEKKKEKEKEEGLSKRTRKGKLANEEDGKGNEEGEKRNEEDGKRKNSERKRTMQSETARLALQIQSKSKLFCRQVAQVVGEEGVVLQPPHYLLSQWANSTKTGPT